MDYKNYYLFSNRIATYLVFRNNHIVNDFTSHGIKALHDDSVLADSDHLILSAAGMTGREPFCRTDFIVLGRTVADGVERWIVADIPLHGFFR